MDEEVSDQNVVVPDEIDKLVSDLGSSSFSVRESATKAILRVGPDAFESLELAKSSKDAEIRQRARLIQHQIIEEAVSHLDQLGTSFIASERLKPKMLSVEGARFCDEDLRHVSCLKSLQKIKLNGARITDSGLRYLAGLTLLKELTLDGTKVGDAGLKNLAHLQWIELLSLEHTRISDDGLLVISKMPRLRVLALSHTEVTNEGIAHLAKYAKLERLWLDSTSITGDAIELLRPLSVRLTHLNLSNVTPTGEDLKTLRGFRQLVSLDLSETNISNTGVGRLASLPRLKKLTLTSASVDDQAITMIKDFPALEALDLRGTAVTLVGLRKLRSAPSIRYIIVSDEFAPTEVNKLIRSLESDKRGIRIKQISIR